MGLQMPRRGSSEVKPLKLLSTYTASFTRDDSVLVTLAKDVVVWDVAKRAKRYRVHPVSHPSKCDFNADGNRLAVKTTAGKIITLDARDGAGVQVVDEGSDGEGANVLYSPCSEYLVDGSWTGSLNVREAKSGALAFRRERDGEMVVRVCRDGTGRVWAVQHSRKVVTDLPPKPDYVSVWAWPFGQPRVFEHTSHLLQGVALSPDGASVATCARVLGKGYHLTVHSAADFEVRESFWMDEDNGYVRQVRWAPDGTELAVVHKGGVTFYRYPGFVVAGQFKSTYPADVAYSGDGRLIAVSDWQSGVLAERGAIGSGASGGGAGGGVGGTH
jgi:WD40 repeat protein